MATDDADIAARVIERLLADPAFRADFRRDPVAACRQAGLDGVADEMAYGAGKAMQTLDIRESRSSLAGVMMAAALEGVGVFGMIEHVIPAAAASPGVVGDVLSRLNLPKVDGLQGALASGPGGAQAAAGVPQTADAGASGGSAATSAAPQGPAVAPTTPVPADAPASGDDAAAPDADDAIDQGAPEPDTHSAAPQPPADPPPSVSGDSGAPIDPAQFGMAGGGGTPSPEALALLDNKNIVLDPNGIADVKAGRMDPRAVALLTKLSEEHKIAVSSTSSDHQQHTAGGSISNHYYGRGFDIASVDGRIVNGDNDVAREITGSLSDLDPAYRPNEIGSPWAINGPGYFTDRGHQDHLHVAFKQAIDSSWKPPADVAAGGASSSGGATAAPAARASDTLSITVPRSAADLPANSSTVQFMRAVRPEEAHNLRSVAAAVESAAPAKVAGSLDYPGDDASKQQYAAWLAAHAQKAGLPPELPVMAALVESGLANLNHGDADSVGFFQMRVGIWNTGAYAGYPERPELQAKWFIDNAVALKNKRIAEGYDDFGKDPSAWGNWIADVERPAEQYRGRYQLRLDEARALLRRNA